MFMTPEPFLSAEISYRRQRIADDFARHAGRSRHRIPRRRFWVRRRRHLALPEQGGGAVIVA